MSMLRLFPVFLLLLALGCQSNLTARRLAAKNPIAKNVAKTPTQMVDVWNTYAQTTPDGTVLRGVAGRIHFYNDGRKKNAVKVDGDLTVFLFDGEEKDPAHAKPLKVYRFKADALPKHYAYKKPLGHGYDFFIPVDEVGGEEKSLCIMARFDDRLEEALVLSAPVNTILKGAKRPTPERSVREFLASRSTLGKTPSDVEQVSFNGASTDEKPQHAERDVTTITLNDQLTRRLNQPVTETPPAPIPLPTPTSQTADSPLPTSLRPVEPASWTSAAGRKALYQANFPEPTVKK